LSFLVSALMLRGIPPAATDAPKARPRNIVAEMREGLAVVWNNPTLRALVWSIGLWQIFRHAFIAIVVLYAARELGFSAGRVGALFMLAGVGSLAAAAFTTRLNMRFGMGPTMLAGIAGTGVAWLAMASAMGPVWLASLLFGGSLFLLDLSAMVFFINYLTLRQAVTPDRLLGRVTSTMIALTVAAAPFGGLAGGWTAEQIGLRATLAIAGLGALVLAGLVAWRSPLSELRDMPEPQEPTGTESVAEELAGD
jgi:MFS family permease